MAFQACVDHHVSLPVALAFDDQSTHRTLEWFATILRGAFRQPKQIITFYTKYSKYPNLDLTLRCVEKCTTIASESKSSFI